MLLSLWGLSMAQFKVQGMEGLMLTLQEIENIPEDVQDKMLSAAADAALPILRKSIIDKGIVRTGQLRDSLKVTHKKDKKTNKLQYFVAPAGKRRREGKEKKTISNTTVGFFNEFGAPKKGIPARRWIGSVLEEIADAAAAAENRVYDEWLRSKNL